MPRLALVVLAGPDGPSNMGRAVNALETAAEAILDLPSGIDATTGKAFDPHVRAAPTVTLALPKTGLAAARDAVGALYLADIGVPPALYARLGLPAAPIFGVGDMLSL